MTAATPNALARESKGGEDSLAMKSTGGGEMSKGGEGSRGSGKGPFPAATSRKTPTRSLRAVKVQRRRREVREESSKDRQRSLRAPDLVWYGWREWVVVTIRSEG